VLKSKGSCRRKTFSRTLSRSFGHGLYVVSLPFDYFCLFAMMGGMFMPYSFPLEDRFHRRISTYLFVGSTWSFTFCLLLRLFPEAVTPVLQSLGSPVDVCAALFAFFLGDSPFCCCSLWGSGSCTGAAGSTCVNPRICSASRGSTVGAC
jgi:hypothetical protein